MRGWAFCVVLAFSACKGTPTTTASGDPAPSASVISIAAALGECSNLDACARECEAGTSDRCRRMGVNFEFGKGVPRDEKQAAELYERACGMGNAEGCLSAGRMYEFHHGVPKDDARAAGFYRRSCDAGDPAGCANLAIMLENGRGLPADLPAAMTLHERACARGAGLACEHLAALRASLEAGRP